MLSTIFTILFGLWLTGVLIYLLIAPFVIIDELIKIRKLLEKN